MGQAHELPERVIELLRRLAFYMQLGEVDSAHEFYRLEEHNHFTEAVCCKSDLHLCLEVEYGIEDYLECFHKGQRSVKDYVFDLLVKDEKAKLERGEAIHQQLINIVFHLI